MRSNAAMADGSVRWLSPDTPETELRALLTRSGGERTEKDEVKQWDGKP